MPDQAGDLLDGDALVAHQADEGGAQLARGPAVPDAGLGADALEHLADVPRVQRGARWLVNTSPVSCQSWPGREPLAGLAVRPGAQRLDCDRGEAEGAAGPLGLGLAVHADRSPDGDVRRDGRPGGGVAVQVDVGPAQRAGFLGAEPAQQAQRDVGVHQLRRAADVFEAGPQFHDGQGRGRR